MPLKGGLPVEGGGVPVEMSKLICLGSLWREHSVSGVGQSWTSAILGALGCFLGHSESLHFGGLPLMGVLQADCRVLFGDGDFSGVGSGGFEGCGRGRT